MSGWIAAKYRSGRSRDWEPCAVAWPLATGQQDGEAFVWMVDGDGTLLGGRLATTELVGTEPQGSWIEAYYGAKNHLDAEARREAAVADAAAETRG